MHRTSNSMSTFCQPATVTTTSTNSSSTPLAASSVSPTLPATSLPPDNSALIQAFSTAFAALFPGMLSSLRDHMGKNLAASGDQTPPASSSSLISNSTTASAASTTQGSLVVPSLISTFSTLGSPPVFSSTSTSHHVYCKPTNGGRRLFEWGHNKFLYRSHPK